MLRAFVFGLLLVAPAFAQSAVDVHQFKKEAGAFQAAINDTVAAVIPGIGPSPDTHGTYLDGYGAVFTLEVSLERPRNPFTATASAADVQQNVRRRQKEIKEKVVALLKQKAADLKFLSPAESIAVVIHLINTNPADVPDLPGQIVVSAKKQDIAAGRIGVKEF